MSYLRADSDKLRANVPTDMRDLPAWLLWKEVKADKPTDKPKKVPYYATGKKRHGKLDTPEDRAELVTFTEVMAEYERDRERWCGPGVALGQLPNGTVQSGIYTRMIQHRCARSVFTRHRLAAPTHPTHSDRLSRRQATRRSGARTSPPRDHASAHLKRPPGLPGAPNSASTQGYSSKAIAAPAPPRVAGHSVARGFSVTPPTPARSPPAAGGWLFCGCDPEIPQPDQSPPEAPGLRYPLVVGAAP